MFVSIKLILFFSSLNLVWVKQTQSRLLAHGHYSKSKNMITACPDPNCCHFNPNKSIFMIWSKNARAPTLKLEEKNIDLKEERSRHCSIEMARPYRLHVWERMTPTLIGRIQESFIDPNIQSQDVFVTSFELGDKVSVGDYTLWFEDAMNGRRYETIITCCNVRRINRFWSSKLSCTWKK